MTRRRLAFLGAVLGLSILVSLEASAQAVRENYIGAGVRSRPAYDGSASQVTELIPMLRYFGGPWFARTTQGILEGGARVNLTEAWALGAQLAYEPGRLKSESSFLRDRDVPDLNPGASFGLHAELDGRLGPSPVNFLARARQHFDQDRGAQLDLRFTGGLYSGGGFKAGAYAQATLANAKALRSFYLTDSGSGGVLSTDLGLLATYDLSERWILFGTLHRTRLQGDAADSPIAERRFGNYASLSFAFRF